MLLKRLFTSNTRIKLLTVFLMNPEEEFFIRELTRKLDEQINSIRRELDNLKKIGLLKSKTKNRKKYYVINKEFFLLEELNSIIRKVLSTQQDMVKKIDKLGKIKLLVLSGQFIDRETTSVDMLLVGDMDKEIFTKFINEELKTTRPVKFTILNESDYKYRLSCHDRFITEIINDQENNIAINRL